MDFFFGSDFKRKVFRGKLAIAITANFLNRNTKEEAAVPEIPGLFYIFNPQFFLKLRNEATIDLENFVYFRDDTHYFVMTARKQSLLKRGVLKQVVSAVLFPIQVYLIMFAVFLNIKSK